MAILESSNAVQSVLPAHIVIAARPPWRSTTTANGARLHTAGNVEEAHRLALALLECRDTDAAAAILERQQCHFGLIVETGGIVYAATDACRTIPVFHATTATGTVVSNDARLCRDTAGLQDFDTDAVLEFAMAGFVTGDATLVRGLHQLEAGSLLVAKPDEAPQQSRYFRFLPERHAAASRSSNAAQLRDALEGTFSDIVARAADRPVFVPISGGVDSRLVLAKLHEHGCRDLRAFSYGTLGNTDAESGRAVAEVLGVPWQFAPSCGKRARAFFDSDERRAWWAFADNLATIPNFQDLQALQDLRAAGALPDDAVIVNGQTGDFLSGGHILKTVAEGSTGEAALTGGLADKHFGLWRRLETPANRARITARIRNRLAASFPDYRNGATIDWSDIAALCQLWEFDERQAKYVINGQRIYDYLGLGWELPLWDIRLVRLFRDLPLEQKLGQRLYLETLCEWNYKDLFAGYSRPSNSWPRGRRFIAPLEGGVQRLLGPAAHRAFHRYARWFGHYHHQYREMTLPVFLRTARDARNLLSLHGRIWLDEAGVSPSPFDQTEAP